MKLCTDQKLCISNNNELIYCDSCNLTIPYGQIYELISCKEPYLHLNKETNRCVIGVNESSIKLCRFCSNLKLILNSENIPFNFTEIYDESIMRSIIQHRRNKLKDFEHEYRCFQLIDDYGLEWINKARLKEKILAFNNTEPFYIEKKERK